MCRVGLKAMNSNNTRRQFDKGMARDMNETLLSLPCLKGDLPALISKWLKKRKYTADSGTSGHFAGALYHDDAPPAGGGSALLSDTLSPTRQ